MTPEASFELREAARKALHEVYAIQPMPVPEGYEALHSVLRRALEQASGGKGKERHASGQPFDEQPMQTISDLLEDHRGMLFQAIKKARESIRLPPGRDVDELLGAVNYLCGAVIWLENNRDPE